MKHIPDMMDPARANALQATLGLERRFDAAEALPPFYHQLYFWEPEPPEALGRDGHPAKGRGLIPDLGLPRRMWAGGRLEFHAPLLAGEQAVKTTRLEKIDEKTGKTGPLAFVTLCHEVHQGGALKVREFQDLVYREDPSPRAPRPIPPTARTDEAESEDRAFNSTTLFRYSALTFNGHRIHYDEAYARDVEHYSGLVVHGPLLAQLLMLFAERHLGPLRRFAFRATSPLMHTESASLCLSGHELWVRGPDGRQCMQATAEA